MRSFIYLFVAVPIALILSACVGQKTVTSVSPTNVFLDDKNQLHYEGYLDKESNELLIDLYEKATVKPNVLVITSGGGDALLGLDLGDWVYDNHLDVLVERMCASSCANYIFTAANRKGLKKDSVLIWHGSSWQKDADKLYRQGHEYIVAWRKRETSFFEKIEVDYRIGAYGLSRYSFWSYVGAFLTADPIVGFDFTIEDLAKFGVTNIYLVDGRWDWRAYTDCCNVKRMELDDNGIL